ncbi:hypothetical protein B0H16DRAFT_1901813 [Mycena metata]|uniref:Uncharacterized protein n=1 Tax=Mycena metata TaxID=1033252 RepID=A0AAD7GUS4_9AGAR|nr:hypothetical protein B0H16DRAFT_1901813 [Mycena metata]
MTQILRGLLGCDVGITGLSHARPCTYQADAAADGGNEHDEGRITSTRSARGPFASRTSRSTVYATCADGERQRRLVV